MKQRLYYLDLAKVLAAFLVVLGHLYSQNSDVRLYLAAFHVPVFFLISGIFHKNIGRVQIAKYSKTLLWPTAFFIAFMQIFKPIAAILVGDNPFKIEVNLLKATGKVFVDGRIGVYWFLVALFWCKVFTDLFLTGTRKITFVLLCILGLFIPLFVNSYFHFRYRILLPFLVCQALMAMPFYLLGFYAKNDFIHLTPKWKYGVIGLLCLVLNLGLTQINGRVNMVHLNFGELQFPFNIIIFYLNGLVGSAMIICISLIPIPKFGIIHRLGEALLAIVGFQALFNYLYRTVIGWDQNIVVSSLSSVVIMLLCYFLHLFLGKYYMPRKA